MNIKYNNKKKKRIDNIIKSRIKRMNVKNGIYGHMICLLCHSYMVTVAVYYTLYHTIYNI